MYAPAFIALMVSFDRYAGFIKVFKRQPGSPSRPETQPLLSSSPGTTPKTPHSSTFDLSLARVSLFIEVISYTLMALAPTALAFTAFSMMASMGAGLNPALQSIALALYRRRGGTESGRLFGALSVLQAMSYVILYLLFFNPPPFYSVHP
ncbi:hypothetical protein H0H87_011501 [Tephrocybe sp. NHM501043]|nr:hypothetical protein H0H87_011501 [Tephrocybe sp. NHM501043]